MNVTAVAYSFRVVRGYRGGGWGGGGLTRSELESKGQPVRMRTSCKMVSWFA